MNRSIDDRDSIRKPKLSGGAIPEPPYCSISWSADQALCACKTASCAIQQLRESIINCPECPAIERCELHEQFNLLIDQAVSAISEEWGW